MNLATAQAIGSIFQELTPGSVGIWVGVLMFGAWMLKEWRETRKLSAADRLARREGYQKQVELLTAENRSLGGDLRDLRKEYNEYRQLCHAETDQLRGQIIRLESDLAGIKRQRDSFSIYMVRLLQGAKLEDILPALKELLFEAGGPAPAPSTAGPAAAPPPPPPPAG
jgi:hypothetical protein